MEPEPNFKLVAGKINKDGKKVMSLLPMAFEDEESSDDGDLSEDDVF